MGDEMCAWNAGVDARYVFCQDPMETPEYHVVTHHRLWEVLSQSILAQLLYTCSV